MAQTHYHVVSLDAVADGIFHVLVNGQPRPQSRPVPLTKPKMVKTSHRNKKGLGSMTMVNPSKPLQVKMKKEIIRHMPANLPTPLFPPDAPLELQAIFKFSRPESHFARAPRCAENIKPEFRGLRFVTTVPDLDNCLKFIMDDPLRDTVYEDDRKVVKIEAVKVYDDHGECRGSTEITVKHAHCDHLPRVDNVIHIE